eukprot:454839-Hanusia_phi.AAC.3
MAGKHPGWEMARRGEGRHAHRLEEGWDKYTGRDKEADREVIVSKTGEGGIIHHTDDRSNHHLICCDLHHHLSTSNNGSNVKTDDGCRKETSPWLSFS